MPQWLSVILEIVKITVPALVVFLTVYYLMQSFFKSQQQLKMLDLKQQTRNTTVPMRMQAYERLSLLCERLALPSMLLRIRRENMKAAELRLALLMAIQQEYEHNITQQVYVSEQLWQIISMAREDVLQTVTLASESVDPKADGKELAHAILGLLEKRGGTGLDKALQGIKKEASLYLS